MIEILCKIININDKTQKKRFQKEGRSAASVDKESITGKIGCKKKCFFHA